MILFFTYHKVLAESGPKPEFYSVLVENFKQHLDWLARSNLRALAPHELREPRVEPGYVLSFDDGTEDHYRVVEPLLAAQGCRAIFFVPTAKLNRPGYLTSAMAASLHKAGHTLGLHSHEHRRLDRVSEEDIRVQMQRSQELLGEITGTRPEIFAPPGGFLDRRVQAVARECGVTVTRTMRWGYNRRPNFAALECLPLNRDSNEAEFKRILGFRSMALGYAAKQMARSLLPERLYQPLRDSVSSLLSRR